jgi:hypothetical protein
MRTPSFPETPPLSDASFSGHLWIQELVTGGRLGFQVAPSGLISFGTPERGFGAEDDVPLRYRRATEEVRENLDLGALRGAVGDADTESVTFFGVATLYEGIEYDWSELPPFLGVDIRSEEKEAYLSPDAATGAYDSLGLSSLPAVEKEAPAEYTDLEIYVSGDMPASEFRDGTAAGVLVRDKSGGRGESWREEDTESPSTELSPEEAADRYVTQERIEGAVESLRETEGAPSVEAVLERVVADTVREEYSNLYGDDDCVFSESDFRSAVAERVRRHLG